MTLQASGEISLANVQTEFGGSNPISISEYYGVAGGVPASGTISLYDFYGKSATPPFAGWTSMVLGYRNATGPQYTTTDNFSGNIITPGAGNSPKTLNIYVGQGTLQYYQGGSLNTTWSTTSSSLSVVFTFGSSSMQFRSSLYDYSNYDNFYVVAFVLDPIGSLVYYHYVNQTGGGTYGSDDD